MTVRANVVAMISLGEIERRARKKKRVAKRGREKKRSKQKQKTGRFQRKKTLRKEGANKNLQKIKAIDFEVKHVYKFKKKRAGG